MLSFISDEEGEIFQVKKSSHSKKVMKMLDKERRKKKSSSREVDGAVDIDATGPSLTARYGDSFGISHRSDRHNDNDRNSYGRSNASANELNAKNVNIDPSDPFYKNRSKNNTYSDSSIHTEIRTDDFVVRLLYTNFDFNFLQNKQTKNMCNQFRLEIEHKILFE